MEAGRLWICCKHGTAWSQQWTHLPFLGTCSQMLMLLSGWMWILLKNGEKWRHFHYIWRYCISSNGFLHRLVFCCSWVGTFRCEIRTLLVIFCSQVGLPVKGYNLQATDHLMIGDLVCWTNRSMMWRMWTCPYTHHLTTLHQSSHESQILVLLLPLTYSVWLSSLIIYCPDNLFFSARTIFERYVFRVFQGTELLDNSC